MLKTIITALDGSAHSARALALAVDLASRYEAELVVCHVVTGARIPAQLAHMAEVEHLVDEGAGGRVPEPPGLGRRGRRAFEHDERMRQAIAEQIVGEAERDARRAGVDRVSTEIREGEAAEELLACAEHHGADAIVLGSRGLSELGGLLLGSVSHKVSQLARCASVTVK